LKSSTDYKDGKRSGKSLTYNEKGEILKEKNWENDKKVGKFLTYHENR